MIIKFLKHLLFNRFFISVIIPLHFNFLEVFTYSYFENMESFMGVKIEVLG